MPWTALKKRPLQLLKLIGVALFLWVLSQLDLKELVGRPLEADPLLLLASFILIFVLYAVKTIRWSVLQSCAGLYQNFSQIWKMYNIGIFFGNITPGKLGEFGRVGYLKKAGMHGGTGASLVLLDRLFDIVVITLLSLVSVWILFGIQWFLVALVCGGVVTLLFFCTLPWTRQLLFQFAWLRFLRVLKRPFVIFSLLFLTLVGWVFYFAWALLLAHSIGIVLPSAVLIAAFTITGMLSLLPIAPAGLGTRETALLILLTPYGIDAEQTIALSLLIFASILISSSLGGWYWLCDRT